MIKMVINDNDNNYEYANDDNGDQATTTFPIMDLRDTYSCIGVQLLMLPGYNIISL